MPDGHGLQIAPGTILPVDQALLPVLEFFRAARLEHQAREWLLWADAPEGLLRKLVHDGYLVKIDACNEFEAAGSFRNVRLVPSPETQRGERVVFMDSGDIRLSDHPYFYLMRPGEDGVPWKAFSLSGDLADVLWENSKGRGIHRLLLMMALKSDDDTKFVVNRVLAGIPMLIEQEYAHLELVRVPRRVKAKAVTGS